MKIEITVNGEKQIVEALVMEGSIATAVPAAAINPEPWPIVLLPLKLLAQPEDRGAGDIIARLIGPIGGDAFKKWYKTLFGKGCGCGARQETLNVRWPLPAS